MPRTHLFGNARGRRPAGRGSALESAVEPVREQAHRPRHEAPARRDVGVPPALAYRGGDPARRGVHRDDPERSALPLEHPRRDVAGADIGDQDAHPVPPGPDPVSVHQARHERLRCVVDRRPVSAADRGHGRDPDDLPSPAGPEQVVRVPEEGGEAGDVDRDRLRLLLRAGVLEKDPRADDDEVDASHLPDERVERLPRLFRAADVQPGDAARPGKLALECMQQPDPAGGEPHEVPLAREDLREFPADTRARADDDRPFHVPSLGPDRTLVGRGSETSPPDRPIARREISIAHEAAPRHPKRFLRFAGCGIVCPDAAIRRGMGMEERAENSAENRALARARAALGDAKRVMDAGAMKATQVPPARAAGRARVHRAQAAAAALTAAASVFLIAAAGYHRFRVSRMEQDIHELSAMVEAAREQQKEAERIHLRRVEELTRELDAMRQPAGPPPRRRFLWIF